MDNAGQNEKKHRTMSSSNVPYIKGRLLNLWFWPTDDYSVDDLVKSILSNSTSIEVADIGSDIFSNLSRNELIKLMDAVSKIESLKVLHISAGTTLQECSESILQTSIPISFLTTFVREVTKLRVLTLSDLAFAGSRQEWDLLTKEVERHPSLQHIRLENFAFQHAGCGLDSLMRALSCNNSVSVVEVFQNHQLASSGSYIRTDGCHVSASTIRLLFGLPNLCIIRISGLNIGDEHISEMAGPLTESRSLKVLLLWQTKMTYKGAGVLAKALSANKTVEVLNLNSNTGIDSAGCQAIFASLKQACIRELYIECHEISKSCQSALIDMINTCQYLERLEVHFNWPQEETSKEIARFTSSLRMLLERNTTLKYLHLCFYDENEGIKGCVLHWGIEWASPVGKRSMEK